MFYTYILLDTTKPGNFRYDGIDYTFSHEPFYVGKGSGRRLESHLCPSSLQLDHPKNDRLNAIMALGLPITYHKYVDDVTEPKALEVESFLIDTLGQHVTLTNLIRGGGGKRGKSPAQPAPAMPERLLVNAVQGRALYTPTGERAGWFLRGFPQYVMSDNFTLWHLPFVDSLGTQHDWHSQPIAPIGNGKLGVTLKKGGVPVPYTVSQLESLLVMNRAFRQVLRRRLVKLG